MTQVFSSEHFETCKYSFFIESLLWLFLCIRHLQPGNIVSEIRKTAYPPVLNYMFKVRWEICSKFSIKMLDQRQWLCSGVLIINFKNLSHHLLFLLLFTLSRFAPLGLKRKWPLRGALQNNLFTNMFKILLSRSLTFRKVMQ